jgi:uncharacterized protein (TIGR00255 family)
MTGYGVADGPLNGGRVQAEIRTVNHRHFNLSLKLVAGLQEVESDLRLRLRDALERGHVSVAVRWLEEPARDPVVSVNHDRARALLAALRRLQDELELSGVIDVAFLARQPEVLTVETGEDAPIDRPRLFAIVDRAVADVITMREREGAALGAELARLLTELEQSLGHIEAQGPARLTRERDRLRARVHELLDGQTLDEARLNQEIALLADKLDITEEAARLNVHVAACRTGIGAAEAVGRRLSFLGQEMLREINTIGSKANDAMIAQEVVAMKGTLEKFREQVENIE